LIGDIVYEERGALARNAAATILPFGSHLEAHLETLPRPDGTNCRIRGHRWSRRARSFSSKLRQRLSAGKTRPVIHNSGRRNSRVRKRFTRGTVDIAWRANGRHIFPPRPFAKGGASWWRVVINERILDSRARLARDRYAGSILHVPRIERKPASRSYVWCP